MSRKNYLCCGWYERDENWVIFKFKNNFMKCELFLWWNVETHTNPKPKIINHKLCKFNQQKYFFPSQFWVSVSICLGIRRHFTLFTRTHQGGLLKLTHQSHFGWNWYWWWQYVWEMKLCEEIWLHNTNFFCMYHTPIFLVNTKQNALWLLMMIKVSLSHTQTPTYEAKKNKLQCFCLTFVYARGGNF